METINRYARSYFSGFCEIWHWKKNDCKTIAFALVKIASYATIIVPGTMFWPVSLVRTHGSRQ